MKKIATSLSIRLSLLSLGIIFVLFLLHSCSSQNSVEPISSEFEVVKSWYTNLATVPFGSPSNNSDLRVSLDLDWGRASIFKERSTNSWIIPIKGNLPQSADGLHVGRRYLILRESNPYSAFIVEVLSSPSNDAIAIAKSVVPDILSGAKNSIRSLESTVILYNASYNYIEGRKYSKDAAPELGARFIQAPSKHLSEGTLGRTANYVCGPSCPDGCTGYSDSGTLYCYCDSNPGPSGPTPGPSTPGPNPTGPNPPGSPGSPWGGGGYPNPSSGSTSVDQSNANYNSGEYDAEDTQPTVGDRAVWLTYSYDGQTDIKILVEYSQSTHTIDKISAGTVGMAYAAKFNPIGNGIGTWNPNNHTFTIEMSFQFIAGTAPIGDLANGQFYTVRFVYNEDNGQYTRSMRKVP